MSIKGPPGRRDLFPGALEMTALQRLLKGGFVEAEWALSPEKRRIRVYRVTPAGEKRLGEDVSRFEQILKGMQLVLAPEKS